MKLLPEVLPQGVLRHYDLGDLALAASPRGVTFVNPVNALRADPKATSELQQMVSPSHPLSSPGYFRDVQNRLKKFVESGQLGPFANGYWGSKAYVLPPEANLMAVTHYLEALDLQKEWVKVHTIFGGKNPHPNYLVGGVPCAINIDGDGAAGAPINMERLNFVQARIQEMIDFNNNVYVPDVLAIGTIYKNAGWLYGGVVGAVVFKLMHDVIAGITPQYWTFWIGLFLVVLVMVGRDRLIRPWTWFSTVRQEGAS